MGMSGVLIVLALLAQLPGSFRNFRVLDVRLLLDIGLLLLDIGLLLLAGARLPLGVGVQVQVDVRGDLGCRLGIGGRWSGVRPLGRTRSHMGRRMSRREREGPAGSGNDQKVRSAGW